MEKKAQNHEHNDEKRQQQQHLDPLSTTESLHKPISSYI